MIALSEKQQALAEFKSLVEKDSESLFVQEIGAKIIPIEHFLELEQD